MRHAAALSLVIMACIAVSAHARVAAPRITASYGDLAQPLPLPYGAGADAESAISRARLRAIRGDKRLLIDLGANWCLNCRLLAGLLRTPGVGTFVARHFEVVNVDIGKFDRNLGVPMRLGFRGRALFVPAVIVIDPRRQRVLNHGDEMAVANTRALTPQQVVDWLARWAV